MWWLYLLVGPIAWLAFALGTFMSYVRMSKLRAGRYELASTPRVTIIVPAKDEAEHIASCLDSVLMQEYPSFQVIAVNDRSQDATGPMMEQVAQRDPRVRVIHIQQLPQGWLGKCNALNQAAQSLSNSTVDRPSPLPFPGIPGEAEGDDWLFFVDSDVTLRGDALRTALGMVMHREIDALSVTSHLVCKSFWEKLLMPLCACAVSTMYMIAGTNNDNRRNIAFANGQFFLIRKSAYDAVGGHAAVRDRITEDVALMRRLKLHDFKTRLYFGSRFVSTRMYDSLAAIFRGWSRIYSGASDFRPWRILITIGFLVLCSISGYIAIFDPALRWLAVVHLALMTAILAISYRLSGNQARYVLLLPLALVMLLSLMLRSLWLCLTRDVSWRGTRYVNPTKSS